ncbi:HupE/UreJ family protein [Paracoccus marinaquae]|uniref:HupE/UreJ family protein n=1 Tax=Paracoccus marinaquae TaxID=2841926 RepID=A0ABS6AMN1_9RHOB|nr:HupE/UreJ family protein [Paracoccus marinaquae]MBU3030696.1 HupE/UreJ family protein [Paracoccus marinaquae]
MRFAKPACLGLAAALVPALSSVARAHVGEGAGGGLISGFVHPLLGADHVMAMVAVGLWGVFLGRPAIWLLPVIFPLVMALGGVMGMVGMPLPSVETGIALSAIVLGLCVALGARAPLWLAAVLVGFFAIFHGYAHGAEMPGEADALSFALGFVIATGVLHLTGILFGSLARTEPGRLAVRAAGAVIALGGVGFLTGVV